jgi:hypothetical protein
MDRAAPLYSGGLPVQNTLDASQLLVRVIRPSDIKGGQGEVHSVFKHQQDCSTRGAPFPGPKKHTYI